MTERSQAQLLRDSATLSIGRSTMRWTGTALELVIDEICAPIPRRVRGTILLMPKALGERTFLLDTNARHNWTPFAPVARVELRLSEPDIRWSGMGYFDANRGSEPLENAFSNWTWSRASLVGSTTVLYDINARESPVRSLALRFSATGKVVDIDLPPLAKLPNSGWGIARHTRADADQNVRVVKTLENAPFYSRTLLNSCVSGTRALAIHESLNLDRFRSRWVQCLLPFRMPRVTF